MAKTLKDLNWSLFAINMLLGFSTGLAIALGNDMSLKKSILTIGLCLTTSATGFFSQAKKQLGGR